MRIKPVIRIEDGKEYEAIADAKKEFPQLCVDAIRTHRKCGGWHWCYKNEYKEELKKDLAIIDTDNTIKHYLKISKRIICMSRPLIYFSIHQMEQHLGLSRYKILKAIKSNQLINGDLYILEA